MKFSPIVCASFAAFAVLALAADATFAGSVVPGASNAVNRLRIDPVLLEINPLDDAAIKACTDGGGAVSKGNNGKTFCIAKTGSADCASKPAGLAESALGGPDTATVTARTDGQRGVWKAPAGMDAITCESGNGSLPAAANNAQPTPK